jgi:transporter family protein
MQRRVLYALFSAGFAMAASCIFYDQALKEGNVATVALIDQGSVIVTILLAWW